jgi:hypothetical protein
MKHIPVAAFLKIVVSRYRICIQVFLLLFWRKKYPCFLGCGMGEAFMDLVSTRSSSSSRSLVGESSYLHCSSMDWYKQLLPPLVSSLGLSNQLSHSKLFSRVVEHHTIDYPYGDCSSWAPLIQIPSLASLPLTGDGHGGWRWVGEGSGSF